MPYKVSGKTVYVKRGGKWVVKKTHSTPAKALAHYRALLINVPEARREHGITTKPRAKRKSKRRKK